MTKEINKEQLGNVWFLCEDIIPSDEAITIMSIEDMKFRCVTYLFDNVPALYGDLIIQDNAIQYTKDDGFIIRMSYKKAKTFLDSLGYECISTETVGQSRIYNGKQTSIYIVNEIYEKPIIFV